MFVAASNSAAKALTVATGVANSYVVSTSLTASSDVLRNVLTEPELV